MNRYIDSKIYKLKKIFRKLDVKTDNFKNNTYRMYKYIYKQIYENR